MKVGKRGFLGVLLVAVVALAMVPATAFADDYRAGSNLKPGTPAYYEAKWQEASAGWAWKDTSGIDGISAPWDGAESAVPEDRPKVQVTNAAGQGVEAYAVETPSELRWAIHAQKNCKLMNDMDMGGAQGKNWAHYYPATLAYTIDGDGHTIYNLYLNASMSGFLHAVSSDQFLLKNVTFDHGKQQSPGQHNAIVAGHSTMGST